MKKLIFIFIVLVSQSSLSLGQRAYGIEISQGFIFYDYFGSEPQRFKHEFFGYGLQTEVSAWGKYDVTDRLSATAAVGLTRFNYLYGHRYNFVGDYDIPSLYLGMKIGGEYRPFGGRFGLTVESSHYFLLPNQGVHRSYNRWFTNVDLGVKVRVFDSWAISLKSPITITSKYDGFKVYKPFGIGRYDPFVEMMGLVLGVGYTF